MSFVPAGRARARIDARRPLDPDQSINFDRETSIKTVSNTEGRPMDNPNVS